MIAASTAAAASSAVPPGAEDWPNHEHSRVVYRAGIRWHVQIMGEGPALLLLHGTGASSHSFRDLMPLLAKRFTVVVPDLPGHAFSKTEWFFEPSLNGMARALDDLLDTLGIRPEIAIGHSAGAALVAQMTLDRTIAPRLLVGIGAALFPLRGVASALLHPTARLLSLASKFVDLRMRKTEHVTQMLRGTGSSLDRAGIELYRRLSEQPEHVSAVLSMMANWDLEPLYQALPRLDTRFLLVAGETDRAVPLSQQRTIAARLPAAHLVVVEGTGHLVHEERPETVARLVLSEIDALPPASGVGGTP